MTSPLWLVTGGCGFIGLNLVERLVADRQRVLVFDDESVGSRAELASMTSVVGSGQAGGVAFERGDIRDAALVNRAMEGVDVVVHLAARAGVQPSILDPIGDHAINVGGLLNVLIAARDQRVKRFLFASSHAPLGDREPPLREHHATHPLSPYGASKAAGEGYCQAFQASYGLSSLCLRFANVYGPRCGNKGTVVAEFLRRGLAGQTLQIRGDGTQSRDFVHVRDIADAIIRAGRLTSATGIVHLGSGVETTIAGLAAKVQTLLAGAPTGPIVIEWLEAARGDILRSASDPALAREVLDWEAKVTLDDGLAEVMEWLRVANSRTRSGSGAAVQ